VVSVFNPLPIAPTITQERNSSHVQMSQRVTIFHVLMEPVSQVQICARHLSHVELMMLDVMMVVAEELLLCAQLLRMCAH
jgi:hypothetical protein